jgi:hypothetical protein
VLWVRHVVNQSATSVKHTKKHRGKKNYGGKMQNTTPPCAAPSFLEVWVLSGDQ